LVRFVSQIEEQVEEVLRLAGEEPVIHETLKGGDSAPVSTLKRKQLAMSDFGSETRMNSRVLTKASGSDTVSEPEARWNYGCEQLVSLGAERSGS
jgi:hypothetical protein